MPDLTDEEYDALDEYWTAHTPKVSGDGKSGFFAKQTGRAIFNRRPFSRLATNQSGCQPYYSRSNYKRTGT